MACVCDNIVGRFQNEFKAGVAFHAHNIQMSVCVCVRPRCLVFNTHTHSTEPDAGRPDARAHCTSSKYDDDMELQRGSNKYGVNGIAKNGNVITSSVVYPNGEMRGGSV